MAQELSPWAAFNTWKGWSRVDQSHPGRHSQPGAEPSSNPSRWAPGPLLETPPPVSPQPSKCSRLGLGLLLPPRAMLPLLRLVHILAKLCALIPPLSPIPAHLWACRTPPAGSPPSSQDLRAPDLLQTPSPRIERPDFAASWANVFHFSLAGWFLVSVPASFTRP